ncbi:MAG: hypothetical protein AB7L65_10435 [Hyphomonadaceae bacterium]
MRVILTALAFSFLSFTLGVVGDLSVVAQAAPQPAHTVHVAIPAPRPLTPSLVLVSSAMAEEPLPALAPVAPPLKPENFKRAAVKLGPLYAEKAAAKAAAAG